MSRSSHALRIAYLFQQFPVRTETFAVSDILALRDLGHEVTVFTLKPPPQCEGELLELAEVPADLEIRRPSLRGILSWPRTSFVRRRDAAQLIRALRPGLLKARRPEVEALLCVPRILEIVTEIERGDFDVVHVFWSRHAGMVLPVLRDRDAHPLRSAFVGAYDLVAGDLLVDTTMASAEVVFSHAEANRGDLDRLAPGTAVAEIIPRGIPLSPLNVEIRRERYWWLTASALVRPKNVEAVIRAFGDAREFEPKLRLKVFGDGPDRKRLERLASELGCSADVTFAGHVQRRELFEEMQRASLFLFLSKKPSERLPNVVKEALWAGCPVISSRSEGIEEVIPSDKIGYLVDPDDSQELRRAISAVLDESASAADKRRCAARLHIQRNFSSHGSMARYAEVWRNLVRRPRPRSLNASDPASALATLKP